MPSQRVGKFGGSSADGLGSAPYQASNQPNDPSRYSKKTKIQVLVIVMVVPHVSLENDQDQADS